MSNVTEVQVWVVIDENGEAVVHTDKDLAFELANDECLDANRRAYCLNVKVPLPRVVEVTGEIAEGADGAMTLTLG